MKKWSVWMEGFHLQGGDPQGAILLGEAEAESFNEACEKVCGVQLERNGDSRSVWGCVLYDNEAAARRFMG